MRPNAFQKILALIYLFLLLVSCIFYVPFRNRAYSTVTYDSIWSDNSNIDLYRIGICLLILSVTFYFLYRYLNKMNDLEVSVYKRKARRELISFIIFILGIVAFLFYLIGSNAINQMRKKSLTETIQKTQEIIAGKTVKKFLRSNFWDGSKRIFNLDEFDNNIQNYWDFLIKTKENDVSLISFYVRFGKDNLKSFMINNPDELKHFIEVNTYNNDDIKKQQEATALTAELNIAQTKKDNLTFYQDNDIKKNILGWTTLLFCVIYVIRPLVLFIKGIFAELK